MATVAPVVTLATTPRRFRHFEARFSKAIRLDCNDCDFAYSWGGQHVGRLSGERVARIIRKRIDKRPPANALRGRNIRGNYRVWKSINRDDRRVRHRSTSSRQVRPRPVRNYPFGRRIGCCIARQVPACLPSTTASSRWPQWRSRNQLVLGSPHHHPARHDSPRKWRPRGKRGCQGMPKAGRECPRRRWRSGIHAQFQRGVTRGRRRA
jgi:hypothetical protein